MASSNAFLVNVANSKKEMTLHEDVSNLHSYHLFNIFDCVHICAVIGRGTLPSLVDKRCSRHQAEITFRGETQDALLFVIGPTPVAVQQGSKKPHIVNVNESYTLTSGDHFMLIPDIDTRYEFQTMGGDGGSKKAEKGEKRTIEDEVDGKRKRSDDSDSDTELKKKPTKKKHPCKYGASCFRKNADHLQQYSHEESGDSSPQHTVDTTAKPKSTDKSNKTNKIAKTEQTTKAKSFKNPFLDDSDPDTPQPNKKTKQNNNSNNTKTKDKASTKKVVPNDDEEDEGDGGGIEIIPLGKEEAGEGEGENVDGADVEAEEQMKPLHVIGEAEVVSVKGDSGSDHQLKYIGGVYSCSCHAWRNQSLPIDNRTCKHLRVYLGDAFESYRLKRTIAAAAAPKAFVQKLIPQLLLAHKWETHIDPTNWWLSEKLDGVRAYWNGKSFISRLGNAYPAPEYFTSVLPKDTPLDGELWCGRKKFQTTVSIVKSMDTGGRWKDVSYQVFDAPAMNVPVEERYEFLHKLVDKMNVPFVSVVKSKRCTGAEDLQKQLEKIESLGGEGLMLRKPESMYVGGRSTTLLKVKTFVDDEAIVRGHEPGKGKHKGKVGSLLVELANGVRVSVGTGLSDAERADPPPVGSIITFRYQELTDAGVPRFPAYLRVRNDIKWPPKKD